MSDLKTVVSISGEYSKRNFTVFDIQSLKGQRQLTKTLPFSPEELLLPKKQASKRSM